jgi:hypothetical protein
VEETPWQRFPQHLVNADFRKQQQNKKWGGEWGRGKEERLLKGATNKQTNNNKKAKPYIV